MCIKRQELEEKITEIRKYKRLAEEAFNIQKALEAEIMLYMSENKLSEEITETARITLTQSSRTTLDKNKLTEILGEDLKPFEKTTVYSVLRIK